MPRMVAPGYAGGPVNKEDLGQQVIEGVLATGTRMTTTIPAGSIGNEQPILVVSEQWFSPDLKVLVMTKHSDPRSGENTYRLTNITQTEPARSLFEVPADYTLKDSVIRRQSPMLPQALRSSVRGRGFSSHALAAFACHLALSFLPPEVAGTALTPVFRVTLGSSYAAAQARRRARLVKRLQRMGATANLVNLLQKQYPADLAQLFAELPDKDRVSAFSLLVERNSRLAMEALSELGPEAGAALLSGRSADEIVKLTQELPPTTWRQSSITCRKNCRPPCWS